MVFLIEILLSNFGRNKKVKFYKRNIKLWLLFNEANLMNEDKIKYKKQTNINVNENN